MEHCNVAAINAEQQELNTVMFPVSMLKTSTRTEHCNVACIHIEQSGKNSTLNITMWSLNIKTRTEHWTWLCGRCHHWRMQQEYINIEKQELNSEQCMWTASILNSVTQSEHWTFHCGLHWSTLNIATRTEHCNVKCMHTEQCDKNWTLCVVIRLVSTLNGITRTEHCNPACINIERCNKNWTLQSGLHQLWTV